MREETAKHVQEFQAQNGSFAGMASSMQAPTPFDKLAGSYGAVDLSDQAKGGAQAKKGQRNLTGSRSDQGYEFQQTFRLKQQSTYDQYSSAKSGVQVDSDNEGD